MPETTALGAAMAAGMAKGVDVWTINPEDKSQINTDVFEPAIDPHGKINLYAYWCMCRWVGAGWCIRGLPVSLSSTIDKKLCGLPSQRLIPVPIV